MKHLTTKQAWEKIAVAFDRKANGGRLRGTFASSGLCGAINWLYAKRAIDANGWVVMRAQKETFSPTTDEDAEQGQVFERVGYYWPADREHAGARAIAAQLLAEEATD